MHVESNSHIPSENLWKIKSWSSDPRRTETALIRQNLMFNLERISSPTSWHRRSRRAEEWAPPENVPSGLLTWRAGPPPHLPIQMHCPQLPCNTAEALQWRSPKTSRVSRNLRQIPSIPGTRPPDSCLTISVNPRSWSTFRFVGSELLQQITPKPEFRKYISCI